MLLFLNMHVLAHKRKLCNVIRPFITPPKTTKLFPTQTKTHAKRILLQPLKPSLVQPL